LLTRIEARVLQVFYIAYEQFFFAVREIPLEEYELHFITRTSKRYQMLKEILPKREIHPESLFLDQGVIAVGIRVKLCFS